MIAGVALVGAEEAVPAANPKVQPEVAMTVHEWGTFTVLQGSDGGPVEWYQAPKDVVDLPAFVRKAGALSKSGPLIGRDLVRMETPVLYFYPEGDQAIEITVSASLKDGRITEIFPPAYLSSPKKTVWQGTLFPPDSPELKKVPAADGPRGRHYAAARAVPDAWLFQGKEHPMALEMYEIMRKVDPKHHLLPAVAPIDHFIFYRGAGNPKRFGISVRQDLKEPNKYIIHNADQATVPKLFALRVRDGKSSWFALSDLATAKYDRAAKGMVNTQSVIFPEPEQAVSEVAGELRVAMIATLIDEGLTPDEAAAMVATWDDLWFTEPGTRVLAVLPQSVADAMVPLEIEPKPSKIERVFVARLELISRAKEARLVELLNQPDALANDLAADAKQLVDIELGRYSSGGMERAMELVNDEMRRRFHALDEAKPDQEATKVTLAR